MSLLQDKHLELMKLYFELQGNLVSVSEHKVSGRLDLTRMFLAKAKWQGNDCIFQTYLLARDIATWYQDYQIFMGETDTTASENVIKEQIKGY